jgi:hypothetical protein
MRRRRFTLTGLALLLVAATAALPARAKGRVLAIGDIHGEYEGLVEILQAAELVDDELRWIGGDATLVQTGDFLDRGKDVRRVMDLLRRLQGEATEAGGRMIILTGNHEQLNLAGELRPEYVTPDICSAFVDEDSEATRREAYEAWSRWQKKNPMFQPRTEEQWNTSYPLGYFEYVEAIGPQGEYGKWLRSLPVAVKVGKTVFLHGGIGPDYLVYGIDKINKLHFEGQAAMDANREFLVRQGTILPFFSLAELNQALVARIQMREANRELTDREKMLFNKTARDLNSFGRLLDAGSPLWFRGYHSYSDDELGELISDLNDAYKTEHYVVAHTVQPSAEIWSRLGGSIFLIDTGMLSTHYGGRPSALEINSGTFTAIYPNDRTVLHETEPEGAVVPALSRQARPSGVVHALTDLVLTQADRQRKWLDTEGNPLPFQTDEEIIRFLETAEIVDMVDIPVGVTKPHRATLEQNGVRAHAAFRVHNEVKERQRMADGSFVMFFRDSYMNEVAAYRLGLMLGIHNIPPAVVRTHKAAEGSLQLWLEGVFDERERMQEGKNAPDLVRFRRQVYDMDVFDALINNLDRNQGNILWDENWNLWMIDHTRAFGRDAKVRAPEDLQMVSQRLYDALNDLDPKEMTKSMKAYMSSFELTALKKRHKDLIKVLDDMIAAEGNDRVVFQYD